MVIIKFNFDEINTTISANFQMRNNLKNHFIFSHLIRGCTYYSQLIVFDEILQIITYFNKKTTLKYN